MGRKEQFLRKMGDDELFELARIASQTQVPDGASRKDLLRIVKSSFSVDEMKGKIWQAREAIWNRRKQRKSIELTLTKTETPSKVNGRDLPRLAGSTLETPPGDETGGSDVSGIVKRSLSIEESNLKPEQIRARENGRVKTVSRFRSRRSLLISVAAVAIAATLFMGWLAATMPSPQAGWSRTYGGTGYDEAQSVQQTSDGGYIVAGYTHSFGAGGYDFWLVKTDGSGNQQWNKTYGGTNDDIAYSVQQTSDGGYIVAGYTSSFGAGLSDFWLVKTDGSGNQQWNKTYGGAGYDEAQSVQQTSDGGYLVAGSTDSFGASFDILLVKTDGSGNQQWNKTYGGAGYDEAQSVQQTSDGGYVVAGDTTSFGAGGYDFWLVKTDGSGNQQWNKTYGGAGYDEAQSVQQTPDGGYIVAGYTSSFGAGSLDFWLVKTDGSGNQQWNKTYGGAGYDAASSVRQTRDGGYIVAGGTDSFGAGGYDFWLVKTDGSGNQQWNKTYGGAGYDEAQSVQQTPDGGYIVAGYTSSFGAGGVDFWLVKAYQGGEREERIVMIIIVGAVAAATCIILGAWWDNRQRI
ncbi:MAG: hypothetical protein WED05_04105 [Candidatus Atabeyarchaeum deiterrae]